MQVEVHCSKCGETLSVTVDKGGDFHICPSCGHSLLIPLVPGKVLGGYKIIRRLGSGGMGSVYLAEQISMGRQVALKILAPELTRDQTFRNRFEKEIRLQAALNHPHIATAYDAGHDGALYYLAMEYLEGRSLDQIIKTKGPFSEKNALRIIRKVAVGLSYAWKASALIHRDIKPSNIMMDEDGRVKVLDMGVSKTLDNVEDKGSVSQFIVGTPQYMSPEQMRGDHKLDHRTDIYALGATLYHMLTGKAPFPYKSLAAVVEAQAGGPAPSPREFNPDISQACVHLIRVMMAIKPEHRYPYWSSLIADISRVLSGNKPMTRSPTKEESMVAASSPRTLEKALKINSSELQQRKTSAPVVAARPATPGPRLLIGVGILVIAALGLIIADFPQAPQPVAVVPLPQEPESETAPESTEVETSPEPGVAATQETHGVQALILAAPEEAPQSAQAAPAPEPPQLQDLYAFITNRMEKFPERLNDHRDAVNRLRVDAELFGFSRYILLADELDQELDDRLDDAKQAVMNALTETAEEHWAAAEYKKAVEIWTAYKAALTEETRLEREAKAEEYAARNVDRLKLEHEKAQAAEAAVDRLVNQAADHLMAGTPLTDLRSAVQQAKETFGSDRKLDKRLKSLLYALEEIDRTDERILDRYAADAGSIVTLDTKRGSVLVRVVNVERPFLHVERQVEQGSLGLALKVEDLSLREKTLRLEKLQDKYTALRLGALALQAHEDATALDYLKRDSSELGEVLTVRLAGMAKPESPVANGGTPTPDASPVLTALKKNLRAANPKYKGEGEFRVEGETITGVNLQQAGEAITDLSPLSGLPIKSLGLAGPGIKSISSLAGMPLKILILHNTEVKTLAPLMGVSLVRLSLEGSARIGSLEPLAGMPLEALDLRGTGVKSLAAVHTAPLTSLMLGELFTSTADLEHFPLVHLDISGTRIASLGGLKMTTLKSLYFVNTPVNDVSPLGDLPLEQVRFDPRFIRTGLNELRTIPTLVRIADSLHGDSLPASVFWGRFDRGFYQTRPVTER